MHRVAHAAPTWSETHLEAPDDGLHATPLSALADRLGEALNWRLSGAHRWRYASVARPERGSGLHALEPREQAEGRKE